MSYIGVQPTAGQYRQLDDISGSFNGATVTFTTSVGGLNVTAGSAEQLLVSLGGVIQNPGADYSVSTNSITFTTAPGSGLDFFAILMGDAVNVGTPADGSVTSVKLASDLTVDLASGTVSAPSLTFDANTGLYSPGADQVAISTNAVERVEFGTSEVVFNDGGENYDFRIESDTNANIFFVDASANAVGIGTSSPTSYSNSQACLTIEDDANPAICWSDTGQTRDWFAVALGSGLSFRYADGGNTGSPTNVTSVLTLDNGGNVGIGTTSPDHGKLTLFDSALAAFNALVIQQGNTGSTASDGLHVGIDSNVDAYIIHKENRALAFGTNNTERARIDSSGRLLVGTSSSSAAASIVCQGTSAGSASAAQLWLQRGQAASGIGAGDTLGRINFADNAGNLFAYIDGQTDGAAGTNDYPSRLVFSTTADGASSPTTRLILKASGQFTSQGIYDFTSASAANVQVDSAGNVSRSTSSIKYKTGVETLEDSYADAILDCRPVWYRSLCSQDDPSWGWWGFIAEEVAEIDPRLVHWKTTESVVQEDGSRIDVPCEPQAEGVQYDRFVPHLLNLIKRQKEQIEAMEARLSALESA